MECLLIFDQLNDIIYTKYNTKFYEYIKNFALKQGLLSEEDLNNNFLNNNVIIQIFSPIVTSHRFMQSQFGNSYTSIKFHEELQLNFSEFMEYLFLSANDGRIKNYVQICVTFARYLCGPNLHQLQMDESKAQLLSDLINNWLILRNQRGTIAVEAIEQLLVNHDITSECVNILQQSVSEITAQTNYSRMHALLLVQDRFLALYSSSDCKQLSSADILFTIILTHCGDRSKYYRNYQVLLAGPDGDAKSLPHIIHMLKLFDKVYLIYFIESRNMCCSASLYETFHHLNKLQFYQNQRDKNTTTLAFENVDLAIKKLHVKLKKIKSMENSAKQMMKVWRIMKGKYKEYFKNDSDEAILRAETLCQKFLDNLKRLFDILAFNESVVECSQQQVIESIPTIKSQLESYGNFFEVKSIRNLSLGLNSLTFNKYMEEFPGLVHFIFVDRNNHRGSTSSIDVQITENDDFIRKKMQFMITFSRSYLRDGYVAVIWKDTTFTYGYFLWFEDSSGKPLNLPTISNMPKQHPGILGEDFYLKLKKLYFPKLSPSRIKCYEFFSMHLKFTSTPTVLEQTRRLVEMLWKLRGFPVNAIDFL